MPGDKRINLRVTEQQHDRIQALAKDNRMSITTFLLTLALDQARPAKPAAKAVPVVSSEPAPIERMYVTEDGDEIELFDGMMRSDPRDEELSQRYNWARDTWEPWG